MKYFLSLIFCFAVSWASAQYKLGREGDLITLEQISFKPNSDILVPESTQVLEFVKKYLDDRKYVTLMRIEANVASSGDNTKDELLAEKRAAAVYKKLVELGVDCKRLLAVSFGSSKPVAERSTPEGKAANAYIKFMHVSINKVIIGGKPKDGGGKEVADNCKRDIPLM